MALGAPPHGRAGDRADYGRIMSGLLDRNGAASVAAFEKAMGPLDRHRAWLASTRTIAEIPRASVSSPCRR